MILSQVSDYLRHHRRATLTDMAHALDATPDALRGMLAALERKGWVRRLVAGAACGGCSKCSGASAELFEWVNA